MKIFSENKYTPYWAGAGLGVLSWVVFYGMDAHLGASTPYVLVPGIVEGLISEQHVRNTPYLANLLVGKPVLNWIMFSDLFLPIGAMVAAWLAGGRRKETVPEIWQSRFGVSPWKRFLGAFIGGAIMLFGARLAGGCTSGHGISGSLQLALSSWIFFLSVFVFGIATAFIPYRFTATKNGGIDV